jgi:hypothetical protein
LFHQLLPKTNHFILPPKLTTTVARRATVGLKLEIDENVFPLINSCHSPRITYSCENTPATLSPFDEPAESLADDDPISSPARTRWTSNSIRASSTSKDTPPPGDQSTLFTKKPNQLPLSNVPSVVGKRPSLHKQLSNTRSALLVPDNKRNKRAKKLDAVSPPNHSNYPDGSGDALLNNQQTRRGSFLFDKENCQGDNRMVPRLAEPADAVLPPTVARPVRVGQIDFQNLPVLDERLRVSVEGYIASWPARQVVIAMNRIVLYRRNVLRWADPSCRPVPLDDLRRALIATRDDMIQQLISACRHNNHPCNNLAEALQHKPIQATIFLHNKECLKTTVDLKRDFTPLGLIYL